MLLTMASAGAVVGDVPPTLAPTVSAVRRRARRAAQHAATGRLEAAYCRLAQLERLLAAERALHGDDTELDRRLRIIGAELAGKLAAVPVPWEETVLRNLAAHVVACTMQQMQAMSRTERNRLQRSAQAKGKCGPRGVHGPQVALGGAGGPSGAP